MTILSSYPIIRPSLNLDFANVKALDPRITFTRTTTATYYGTETAKAEENLLLYSQDFATVWGATDATVTANTEVAPDGTTTADTLTADSTNGILGQTRTYGDGGDATFSVWIKRKTGTGNVLISHTPFGSSTIVAVDATWQRFSVTTALSSGTRSPGIKLATSGDEVYVWGAQLEIRSTATAYTPTTTQAITNYIPVLQTAASGVARFDHNPTTGESLGLLVEEQRTNLLTYSAEFDNAAWTKVRASITANTIVAPDGTLTGDKLAEDTTASNSHFIGGPTSFTTASASLTLSVYAKKAERSIIRLQGGNSANWGTAPSAYFNLDTGVITQTDAGTTSTITPVGNGWYRCSITGTTASSGVTNPGMNIYLVSTGTTFSYTGDGYSGVFLWGAQIEAASFSTSYIATTSASVTRNADAASMTGTNFSSWFNNAEGAVYSDYKTSEQTNGFRIASVSDGTTSNRMEFAISSGGGVGPYLFVVANGTNQVATGVGTYASNTNYKWAAAYEINNYAWSKDGGSVVSDTDALIPVVNQLRIGQDGVGLNLFSGTIKKLAFYPARLTNAQLQALTS